MLQHESYNGRKLSKAEQLTFAEESEVVSIINSLIDQAIEKPDTELLQKFITNFESLRYFRDKTVGLWATEFPDDVISLKEPIKLMDGQELPTIWQIKY